MQDYVKGKRKGLVILLHGPPGVGKTLTAESVAQNAGRPLFSISLSDIRMDAAEGEHNLEPLFELEARWRAVLLFDEADVFLESRGLHTSDLKRNALVSALLRILEYYPGILMLMTNRVSHIDIAVQSRVNLGIRYSNLTVDQKRSIYKQFISQIPDDRIEDRQAILEWYDDDADASDWLRPLNGRQLRNILFSTDSLASKTFGKLKLDAIKKMARHTSMFHSYLKPARKFAEAGHEED
jgi:SpoVK/Ycf46/Vps4 family AAA+-type ATPase